MTTKERVIIDTDPGVDDCMALFLALSRPEKIQIEGITIVFGNHHDLELLASNACRVLQLCNKTEIPVVLGRSEPLKRKYNGHTGILVHGEDGIGNLSTRFKLPDPSVEELKFIFNELNLKSWKENVKQVVNKTASDFIIEKCKENPGEITLITLGPLSNIAEAITKCPELPTIVKRVFTMGGTLNFRGNVTPVAEANIWNDPEAANIVFNSGFNLTLSPLNVTTQIKLNGEFINSIRNIGGNIGMFIFEITKHYIDFFVNIRQNPHVAVHDSTAVMSLLKPDLFVFEEVYVDVETVGELTLGMTIPDWRGHWKDRSIGKTIKVGMLVDSQQFIQFYLQSLEALVKRVSSTS